MRRNRQLTQSDVAELLNVERLSIIRYEQGMFNHLNEQMLVDLAHIYRVKPGELEGSYLAYQEMQRLEFSATHDRWGVVLRGYQGLRHPLVYYREYYELSRNGLCKALCLDYGPIADYENDKQRAIPEVLRNVSEQMHWDYTQLESAVLEWRSSGRSDIK